MLRLDDFSFKQLRYFLAVAEAGSFRRAADKLDISQPSLTTQIAKLESAMNIQLFERSRVGTQLTPAGRELVQQARNVIEQATSFCHQANSLTGEGTRTYRLGVTPLIGPYLLPLILPEIHNRNTHLKLYVREGVPKELEEELKQAHHDLLLTTLPVNSRELVTAPLFYEPIKLAISQEHPLASKPVITKKDLYDQEVLTIGENHLFNSQVSRICQKLGANLRREYEGTSLATLRHMVVMGMGLAFLPSLYVESEIRDDERVIRVVTVEGLEEYRLHALVWRQNSPDRNLYRNLAQQMRDVIGKNLFDIRMAQAE